MRFFFTILLFVSVHFSTIAAKVDTTMTASLDSIPATPAVIASSEMVGDSVIAITPNKKPGFFKRLFKGCVKIAEDVIYYINEVDSSYISPQEYNWEVMLQSTTTFESYRLKSKSGQEFIFAPENKTKIGPYGGWRWIFLGYTFDIKNLNMSGFRDINISIYSSLFTLDLIWRESGKGYKIKQAELQNSMGREYFEDLPFAGLETSIKGFNFNWIFNKRKYSNTAAYSQSNLQLKSAGSPTVGIGYMRHKLWFDYPELRNTLNEELDRRYPGKGYTVDIDTTLRFKYIDQQCLTFSAGYAYNFVLAKNLLLATSLTAGISFKKSLGDSGKDNFTFRDFTINNLNFDACGRMALVYNNMRWYAGAVGVMHFYSYRAEQFNTSNWFANVSLYVGINFGRRKEFRDPQKRFEW
ncbi:MAG: DUF4421 domain-containing protein [Bacteroidaceae bacterium]|nr:DUF4421 domain-containing protein [Bacteroidaceae bacterium]